MFSFKKSIQTIAAFFMLTILGVSPAFAQYDLDGFLNKTEIEFDDAAYDATDASADISFVADNPSILTQSLRLVDINERRTLRVNSGSPDDMYDFCWKDTKRRGVGKIPKKCSNSSDEFKAGLCYPKCRDGYKGATIFCRRVCPSGWRDDGLYCRKDSYSRGRGKIKRNCSGDCEKIAGLWYTKCRSGYEKVPGVPTRCRASGGCPSGLRSVPGVPGSCRKDEYKRGVGKVPKKCDSGMEYDAGLCYRNCPSGYSGVGPVCWAQCPSNMVNCGAACASSKQACASGVVGQVTATLEAAMNIIGLVVSGGSSAGAGAGDVAATVSNSAGQTVEIISTVASTTGTIASSVVESDLISAAGGNVTNDQREKIEEYGSIIEELSRTHNIPWDAIQELDPTGLAKAADSFARPKCSKLSSGGTEPPSNSNDQYAGKVFNIESKTRPGHFVDVAGNKTHGGANVLIWSKNGPIGTKNQQFKFVPAGNGYYYLESMLKPNMVLDVKGAGTGDNTNIQLFRKNGTKAQKFKVEKAGNGLVRLQSGLGSQLFLGLDNAHKNIVLRRGHPGQMMVAFYLKQATN